MSSPDGGFNAQAYNLPAGVAVRLWAAENDPDGCTVINGDPAAVVFIGNQAVQASLAGGGQMVGPLKSVSRNRGELYAISAQACTIQVVEGQSDYAEIGTPGRNTEIGTCIVRSAGNGQTWPGADTSPSPIAMTSQGGGAAGACKLFLTYAQNGDIPNFNSGSSVQVTLVAYYAALAYTQTLASITLNNSSGRSGGITPADVSILAAAHVLQITWSTNQNIATDVNIATAFTATLVPE